MVSMFELFGNIHVIIDSVKNSIIGDNSKCYATNARTKINRLIGK